MQSSIVMAALSEKLPISMALSNAMGPGFGQVASELSNDKL